LSRKHFNVRHRCLLIPPATGNIEVEWKRIWIKCRWDGLVVRTKRCKCLKPGSTPGWVESILMSGIVVYYSTRDERELSRLKKALRQVWARWSNGKDEVLHVWEARFDSWLRSRFVRLCPYRITCFLSSWTV
jgi:hypothetical protein